MNSHTPESGAPSPAQSLAPAPNSAIPPPAASSFTRWRWILFVVAALLLAGGAMEAWWLFRRPPVAAIPPIPADMVDPEVEAAIGCARQRVVDNPRDANVWGYYGKTLWANLFDLEADRCFEEAARLDSRSPSWPYARGLISLRREPDRALPLLRQALKLAGDGLRKYQSAICLQLAEALLERNDWDDAEKLFQEEWERHPNDPRTALGLGLIAAEKGQDAIAVNFLTIARASPSARRNATAHLAILARIRKEETLAGQLEKEAALLPPDEVWPDPLRDEVVQFQAGQRAFEREVSQLERDHRFAEAVEMYKQKIDRGPTPALYTGAGINEARQGHYEQAIHHLDEALHLDPDYSQAHYTLALVKFSRAEKEWQRAPASPLAQEWFRETVAHARRAATLKPHFAQTYLYWGVALRYLAESGNDSSALELGGISGALGLTYLHGPVFALGPLRKGVVCQPSNLELQLALGETLLQVGQYKEAERYLKNADQLAPNNDLRPRHALEQLRMSWWNQLFQKFRY